MTVFPRQGALFVKCDPHRAHEKVRTQPHSLGCHGPGNLTLPVSGGAFVDENPAFVAVLLANSPMCPIVQASILVAFWCLRERFFWAAAGAGLTTVSLV